MGRKRGIAKELVLELHKLLLSQSTHSFQFQSQNLTHIKYCGVSIHSHVTSILLLYLLDSPQGSTNFKGYLYLQDFPF